MRRATILVVVVVGSSLAPFAACSDSPSSTSSGDTSLDAGRAERGMLDDGGAADTADTVPVINTDGWIRVGFDPDCSFFAPPSADKMPPSLDWQPCSSTAGALGVTCRQTRNGSVAGSVDVNGKAWLTSAVLSAGLVVDFVAEADGRVHTAISHPASGRCGLTDSSLNGGKVVFTALRWNSNGDTEHRGAIGGDVDKPPVVLESWGDAIGRGYIAGPVSYFVLGPENAVRPYTPGSPPLGTVTVTDPGQIGNLRFVGEELFFQVSNLAYGRIKVFSPALGARDLISFGNDVSAKAADFGTDGVDMVWLEAFGRTDETQPFTTINIVTSKFTPDATKIEKRRLRSENSTIGVRPFVVGCGYGARDYSNLDGNGVRVVRLSDGWSWRLKEVLPPGPDAGGYWFPQQPLAVTCDELFVSVDDSGSSHVARIRLDSLGAGEAPD